MTALPSPKPRHVYRVDANLDALVDLGETPEGHRRIIAWTGGRAEGPETSDPELSWLNDGVFIAVGGRQPSGVSYDVYLVE
jgi:hypothetical protein